MNHKEPKPVVIIYLDIAIVHPPIGFFLFICFGFRYGPLHRYCSIEIQRFYGTVGFGMHCMELVNSSERAFIFLTFIFAFESV